MKEQKKSRVFIGSTVENLEIANAIQAKLDYETEPVVWDQNIFSLSQYSLESLLKELDNADFAIFVFTPNDITQVRKNTYQTTRDNIIFELGLFIGRLGRERSFIILPRDLQDFHLPTDLLGITPAYYNSERQDKNLDSAVAPACHKILLKIKEIEKTPSLSSISDIDYYQNGRVPLEITVDLLRSVRSEITVVGSSLRSFVSHFEQRPDYKFKDKIQMLLEKSIDINIFIMNPESEIVINYATDRNDTELLNHTKNSLNILKTLANEFSSLPGKFNLYKYNMTPFSYILMVDQKEDTGRALLTHYLPANKKANCPYIKLHKTSTPVAFKRYIQAIEEVFRKSEKVI